MFLQGSRAVVCGDPHLDELVMVGSARFVSAIRLSVGPAVVAHVTRPVVEVVGDLARRRLRVLARRLRHGARPFYSKTAAKEMAKANRQDQSRAGCRSIAATVLSKRAADQGYRVPGTFKLATRRTLSVVQTAGMWVVDLGAAPGGWTQVRCVQGPWRAWS